ncbi:MAG: DODA-type extradiol aromatic ring-opening family dioxygenase [Pseudomonadota bacterium]
MTALFVSHGAPTLIGEDVPARDFLAGLGNALPKPEAVLAVSAHWETAKPTASTMEHPETIHDFSGFPDYLYKLHYQAKGAPELARRAAEALSEAGFGTGLDAARGLDHGAWCPLMLMYPDADIPVAQLSIQPHLGPGHHLALGRALAGLGSEGVMVLASGGAVHNLARVQWGCHDSPPDWARQFDDWLAAALAAGDEAALVDYRRRAPGGALAHPRDEHFLPLFVALGAGGPGARGRRLHASFTHGSLSMAAFKFA